MKKPKKILAVLLCMCMAFLLIPTVTVSAAGEVWVNGVDITTAVDNTVTCGSGTAVYDTSTNTLTLNNATITEANLSNRAIAGVDDLIIELIGTNTISISTSSQAIFVDGDLTFNGNGTGSLKIDTTDGINSTGDMIINNATLNINISDFGAISTDKNIYIRNGANVETNGLHFGLYSAVDTVISNSTVVASASANNCNALTVFGKLTIEDSNVTAKSYYPALFSSGDMLISSSKVNSESTDDCSIYTSGVLTINSESDVTANGYYSALQGDNGIVIDNATIFATSTYSSSIFTYDVLMIKNNAYVTASGYYCGLLANSGIVIDGATINATAIDDVAIFSPASISINGNIDAKGGTGYAAIAARENIVTVVAPSEAPEAKIEMNVNYEEVSGGIISVSERFTPSADEYRSMTSFIASGDSQLKTDMSNALNEVTIRLKGADYTDVDAAIAAAEALVATKDNYTNYAVVETAVNAVVRGKDITEQSDVDAMAKAIEDAIAALEYKDADYTKVNEAIAKANGLNKDDYVDFSAVEAAINAVVTGKNITEQSDVDAMAKAIGDAIEALVYKGADYTAVDAAIKKAEALNKDDYIDFTAVDNAINAVVEGKNITEQADVEAMATAINDAVAALVYKDADYTAVDAAIKKAEALNKNDYVDFSAVEAAINAVVTGKNITEQSDVDAMAQAIEDAINALVKKTTSTAVESDTSSGFSTTSSTTTSNAPATNDTSSWFAFIILTAAGLMGMVIVTRKRRS